MEISQKDFQKIIKTLESIDKTIGGQAIKGDITEYLITGSKLYEVQELLNYLKKFDSSLADSIVPVATEQQPEGDHPNFLSDDFFLSLWCRHSKSYAERLISLSEVKNTYNFFTEEDNDNLVTLINLCIFICNNPNIEKEQGGNLSKYSTLKAGSLSHSLTCYTCFKKVSKLYSDKRCSDCTTDKLPIDYLPPEKKYKITNKKLKQNTQSQYKKKIINKNKFLPFPCIDFGVLQRV